MLSRAATSLTLLGRHLERADHLARILGVHVALSLDRTDEPGPEFWTRFMELAGWPGSDTGRRDQAVEMIVTGSLGPSVRASVAAARLAAQAVRPSLPSELYEQVNALHWRVQEPSWQPDLYPFLTDVQLSIRLVDGLLMDTMQHDEARDFVRLGKFVERTANVTMIVTRKSAELAEAPEDALEWSAVLKSCFAFESYQSRYSGGVTAERVIECLLLDPALPRSARFSAQVALDSVSRIDGPGRRSKPRRLLSRLHAMFVRAGTELVAEHPREFESEARDVLRQLELAMRETYFHPSKVPANVIGDEGRAMPQQQQQSASPLRLGVVRP
ncbi:MAG TPA: alpha-E domain-containing protein [Candidatus Angelobacter sp.]|nr:alpha-E domain-containing protein [Candidatus Angelobacter sp.]